MATHEGAARDGDMVLQALAAGRITVPDPATGHRRSIYAKCPNDGRRSRSAASCAGRAARSPRSRCAARAAATSSARQQPHFTSIDRTGAPGLTRALDRLDVQERLDSPDQRLNEFPAGLGRAVAVDDQVAIAQRVSETVIVPAGQDAERE